jgi:hypothetical protein
MRLPLSIDDSGFGIKLAATIAPAAFLASLCLVNATALQLLPAVSGPAAAALDNDSVPADLAAAPSLLSALTPSLTDVNASLPADSQFGITALLQRGQKVQSKVSAALSFARVTAFMARNTVDAHTRQVIKSCVTFGNGGFLRLVPMYGNQFDLTNREFAVLCRRRLGKSVFSAVEGFACQACARKGTHVVSDCMGDHAASCPTTLHQRHAAVAGVLIECARRAGLRVSDREPTGLLASVDATPNRRPADVFINCWKGHQDIAIDVSVVANYHSATRVAGFDPMATINTAAATKVAKYRSACSEVNLLFSPFIVGTYGGFDREGLVLMDELQRRISDRLGISASYYSSMSVRLHVTAMVAKHEAHALLSAGSTAAVNLVA